VKFILKNGVKIIRVCYLNQSSIHFTNPAKFSILLVYSNKLKIWLRANLKFN
jgi:hypothetical protein